MRDNFDISGVFETTEFEIAQVACIMKADKNYLDLIKFCFIVVISYQGSHVHSIEGFCTHKICRVSQEFAKPSNTGLYEGKAKSSWTFLITFIIDVQLFSYFHKCNNGLLSTFMLNVVCRILFLIGQITSTNTWGLLPRSTP